MWKWIKRLWEILSHVDTAWSIISAIPWYKLFLWILLPLVAAVLGYVEALPLSSVLLIALCVFVLLVAFVGILQSKWGILAEEIPATTQNGTVREQPRENAEDLIAKGMAFNTIVYRDLERLGDRVRRTFASADVGRLHTDQPRITFKFTFFNGATIAVRMQPYISGYVRIGQKDWNFTPTIDQIDEAQHNHGDEWPVVLSILLTPEQRDNFPEGDVEAEFRGVIIRILPVDREPRVHSNLPLGTVSIHTGRGERFLELRRKHDDLIAEFKAFKQSHGRWRLIECGRGNQSLNLSVAIQFIDPQDADLAERIYGFFWPQIPGSPWQSTRPIEQVNWFKNPSTTARIVIFSDHAHADGIKAAFNDCELLEERVARFDRSMASERQMIADIVFVIFSQKGQVD